jgi:hypothetical protein
MTFACTYGTKNSPASMKSPKPTPRVTAAMYQSGLSSSPRRGDPRNTIDNVHTVPAMRKNRGDDHTAQGTGSFRTWTSNRMMVKIVEAKIPTSGQFVIRVYSFEQVPTSSYGGHSQACKYGSKSLTIIPAPVDARGTDRCDSHSCDRGHKRIR